MGFNPYVNGQQTWGQHMKDDFAASRQRTSSKLSITPIVIATHRKAQDTLMAPTSSQHSVALKMFETAWYPTVASQELRATSRFWMLYVGTLDLSKRLWNGCMGTPILVVFPCSALSWLLRYCSPSCKHLTSSISLSLFVFCSLISWSALQIGLFSLRASHVFFHNCCSTLGTFLNDFL